MLAGVRGTDATTIELGGTLSCATKKLPVLDMGKRKFQDYISDECHRRYSCVHCRAHLANHDELISKVCFESYFMYCCGIYIFSFTDSRSKEAKARPTSSTKCKHSYLSFILMY